MGKLYELSFTEFHLSPTLNVYKRMHWAVIKKEKQHWIDLIRELTANNRPDKPLTSYTLELVRRSSVVPDYDGICGSFKIVIDALTSEGIIQDDKYTMTGPWNVTWEKCPPKKGNITVILREKPKELDYGSQATLPRSTSSN